jgi:hypothetical protein
MAAKRMKSIVKADRLLRRAERRFSSDLMKMRAVSRDLKAQAPDA